MCVHVCMHVGVCVHVCVHVFVCAYVCMCVHVCASYVYACTICACVCMCEYMYVCVWKAFQSLVHLQHRLGSLAYGGSETIANLSLQIMAGLGHWKVYIRLAAE